jgi:hypothetical protein
MIRNNVLTHTVPAPTARRGTAWTRRQPNNKMLWLVIGSLIVCLFLAVFVRGIGNYPFWSLPQVTAVDPPSGLPGEILTMLGRDLGKRKVAEVYLTDGTQRWRAEIVHQSPRDIRFRMPANVDCGTLHLVLTTPGNPQRWVPQTPPVFVPAAKR